MPDDINAASRGLGDAPQEGERCAYVVDGGALGSTPACFCAARRQPGSAYCPTHHAQCHLASGSTAEKRRLREIEVLATAVGGRRGQTASRPPAPVLRRLERLTRVFP